MNYHAFTFTELFLRRCFAGAPGTEVIRYLCLLGRLCLYTDSDRRFVAAYIHEKLISGEIGDRRSLKIVQTLCRFRRDLECEFKDCTIIDYKNAIGSLFSKGSFKTKDPLSSHAIADYVTITKGFFRWMIETETGAITETQLQKIKVPKRTKKQILKPSDLLTPDEVITFIECCTNSRDRALFSLMYEGGFRIGEIGTLRWGDLNFDKYGIQATISFKTNKIRTVRLLSCVQYMSAWKQDYPGKISSDEPVSITRQNNPVKHGQMIKQMHAIAERAGINKRIYPHLFRHSRITHMLADGIHESVIKLMM